MFHGAEKNCLDIVKLLVESGADLSLKDRVKTVMRLSTHSLIPDLHSIFVLLVPNSTKQRKYL